MLRWLFRAWLLFAAILLMAGGGLAYAQWMEVRQAYANNLSTLAAAVADGTHLFLDGAQISLQMLDYENTRDLAINSFKIHERLQNYLIRNPDFSAVGVRIDGGSGIVSGTDRDLMRTLLSSTTPPARPYHINRHQRQRLTFCDHAPDFCFGPPLTVQASIAHHRPRWVVPLFMQIQSKRHHLPVRSRIVALLPLQHGEFSFWRNIPLPVSSKVFLLRQDGFLESLYPAPSKTTFGEMQNGIAVRSIEAHPDARSGTFYGLATAINQWRLGAWYRVPDYPLVAGVGVARSVLITAWWNRMAVTFAAIVALLLLSTILYVTFRRIGEERLRERALSAALLWDAKEKAEVTLQSIGDAVVTTDTDGRITEANPVAEKLLGYPRHALLGQPLERVFRIVREGDHQPVENPVRRVLREGCVVGLANHTVLLRSNGDEIAIEDSASAVRGRDGQVLGAVLVFHDVTERRRLIKDLAHQANHDDLTGLPNRKWFLEQLLRATQEAQSDEGFWLVGILDLDGFKQVNDRWGHDHGDQLLRAVTQRAQDALRSEDMLARLGGDEFGLLLRGIGCLEDAQQLAEHLLRTLAQPISLTNQVATISASIGFAIVSREMGEAEQTLRHADIALYAAKSHGRNQYRFYEKSMDLAQEQLMEMLMVTQEALEEQRLVMYYQPLISRPTDQSAPEKAVIGFEALIRMRHPQHGILTPNAFAQALDHPRLARRIGCYVLETVLTQGELWHMAGLPLRLSLNISARHLLDSEFLHDLQRALAAHPNMPPQHCEIEITESAPMQDFQKAQETLQKCNEMGLRIALDDFGTGNASLSYLQKLPAQTIKIDQSFVRDLLNDPRDFAIVSGITKTATLLGLEVVAEGVETAGQFRLLETMPCQVMQGYLFAKPMPAQAVPAWVNAFNILNYDDIAISVSDDLMNIENAGLLLAHNLRIQETVRFLQGRGYLPERIIGSDDMAHCHLALWLNQLPLRAACPSEVDDLHRRLHEMISNNVYQPGSPEALQIARELLETNAQILNHLHRFLGCAHAQ